MHVRVSKISNTKQQHKPLHVKLTINDELRGACSNNIKISSFLFHAKILLFCFSILISFELSTKVSFYNSDFFFNFNNCSLGIRKFHSWNLNWNLTSFSTIHSNVPFKVVNNEHTKSNKNIQSFLLNSCNKVLGNTFNLHPCFLLQLFLIMDAFLLNWLFF